MGETTNQIEAHIEETRKDLGSNLTELEQKVKSVTDWRHHFQTHPATMLGVAFGGGVLLAAMMGGRRSPRTESGFYRSAASEPMAVVGHQKQRVMDTWDHIKGALIGVAAARFKDFIGEVVPGFQEQLQRTQDRARVPQPSTTITM